MQLTHSGYQDTNVFGTKVQGGSLDLNIPQLADQYRESTLPMLPYQEGHTGSITLKMENIFIMTKIGIYVETESEPLGNPLGSGYISPYIHAFVIIQKQYNISSLGLYFKLINNIVPEYVVFIGSQ